MFYSSHKISRAISSLNPLSNPHQKDSPSTLVPNPPTEVDIASLPVLHLNLMKKNCLFLLKKDGQKGSIFEIKKDLKFGWSDLHSCHLITPVTYRSDHPANIRIKSSSIAKEHAIIQVCDDQNVFPSLLSLYVTYSSVILFISPPQIHQKSMEKNVVKSHYVSMMEISSQWEEDLFFSNQVRAQTIQVTSISQ